MPQWIQREGMDLLQLLKHHAKLEAYSVKQKCVVRKCGVFFSYAKLICNNNLLKGYLLIPCFFG